MIAGRAGEAIAGKNAVRNTCLANIVKILKFRRFSSDLPSSTEHRQTQKCVFSIHTYVSGSSGNGPKHGLDFYIPADVLFSRSLLLQEFRLN